MDTLWGIDLGGTKIEGIILEDRASANVLKRLRIPTEADRGYQHILEQIIRLVEVLTAEAGIRPSKLGIGTPGILDPATETIKNANTACLNGQPFKKDLEQALGMPIALANDANCFTLAETTLGVVKDKAPDAQIVFGAILGTGVGGGIVINNQLIEGRQGIAGEWGHNFLDDSGGDCYCGRTGCIETILSGPALERYYESMMGIPLGLQHVAARYSAGQDEVATRTVERLLQYFGKAMAQVINILDPDVIILGGGLGNIDLLYTQGVEEVSRHVFNNRLETIFLKPKLGDSAGVFGAALL